ncbi:CaiB/BaiF CoA transferase family protein [Prescottella agglutinans]|jgi:crotonobetainyl-CoA:carnitine CoA-transferase CaiB-like acyl-CoA transferase|uniref:Alpha-methylacyl-CoA racemase n=1 Tax=Prescottella agglutinans TaxID=1644129 RepID=A0ABT6MB08_9NOCA|nr:CoA transferase [Prescottella agglutinans]MDH6281476.1 alpha-methylacyl-CoA racemase [Prescottella agglutinans]
MAEPLLAGVRVVESASLLTGATVGMLLADLGADVVKVEPPHGDLIRWALGQVTPGYSPAHLQLNRNKRSVTLDMRAAEGLALFRRLIEGAAVLVDGNAPGTLAKLGLSDGELAQLNPGLVHCSVSGYGASGPYAAIPTHGLMMSALVGANPTTVTPDGGLLPAEYEGASISGRGGDAAIAAGSAAAMQICAALVRRERRGVGCRIDVSGADALLAQSMIPVVYQANLDRIADTTTLPMISDGTSGPRYRLYATADRRAVAFTALEPKFWARFCRAVGREDLLDARPDDTSLEQPLTEVFATRTQQQWMDLAIAGGLAIGPVRSTLGEIVGDEHLRHRGVFVESEHPVAGAFTHVGMPGLIDDESFGIRLHAPGLGEHNDLFESGWPS